MSKQRENPSNQLNVNTLDIGGGESLRLNCYAGL